MPDQPIHCVRFIDNGSGTAAASRSFLANEADLLRVVRREQLTSVLTRGFPLGLLVGLAIWRLGHSDHRDNQFVAPVAGLLVAIPCLFYGVRSGAWQRFRRTLQKAAEVESGQSTSGTHVSVSIEPEGVRWTTELSSAITYWKQFSRVGLLETHLVIWHAGAASGVAVPLSAFETPDGPDAWAKTITDAIDKAGTSETMLIRAELDRGPVKCGRCGQQLRGIRDPRCPECGTPLSPLRVRIWRELQVPFWSWANLLRPPAASNRED